MPHPSTLEKITKDLKVYPGGYPNIYLPLKEQIRMSENEVIGHLMMDEIKHKMV